MRNRALLGLFTFVIIIGLTSQNVDAATKPHIIFLLADDLGYNDVSYHGRYGHSAIKTPYIDQLASSGVTLENYYVQPICSPTRSQLMSGRYQIHTGLMHGVIRPPLPSCLPLDEVTLPQKLKESGYATHIVGKWHLGFYKAACMPTNRGFDSHLGYLLGAEDYYSHSREYTVGKVSMNGYDFRNNTATAKEYHGEYSLFAFVKNVENIIEMHDTSKPLFLYVPFQNVHGPLQVPEQYRKPYSGISNGKRREYAGMTSALDEAVANITKKLQDEGLYNNSVIIFSTDNGGPIGSANNWPLRGSKGTLWEGGVRGVGLVHSPLLSPKVIGTVSREFIHVSDWFPTLVQGVAGGNLNGTKPLDGFNVWNTIAYGEKSPRTELLHNIDPLYGLPRVTNEWSNEDQRMYDELISQLNYKTSFNTSLHAALRVGDWKILTGGAGTQDWYVPPESDLTPIKPIIDPKQQVWLFNITADPNEHHDLSKKYPDVVKSLLQKLEKYWSSSVPVQYPPPDLDADPALHGGYWGPWRT